MGQITVMTGPERRRRWRDEERFQILAEAFAPGACVADVARRWDVSTSLIYTWRRNLRREQAEGAALPMADVTFAQAVLAEDEKPDGCDRCAAITVELGEGRLIRISAGAPAALVSATLKALR
ncbi:IS66-like element accessory protein TnpA [Novosphingobium pentaromativorans]|uniref:Transposase IS3/IS911 family protein n=1 Tax=Novosphingobium pentaromativorans US6-1 TaxID=1088721 RepID=G6EDJ2_9SPHN|nr:transposase [Novosphingobium pentaromativorans]AIT79732.1 transposase [Novosphingobium pentaromativorans US6-1]EHJ60620.1 transposase IS3/IS911 family protein [Novosphingobium pentaromativorans US6-1]